MNKSLSPRRRKKSKDRCLKYDYDNCQKKVECMWNNDKDTCQQRRTRSPLLYKAISNVMKHEKERKLFREVGPTMFKMMMLKYHKEHRVYSYIEDLDCSGVGLSYLPDLPNVINLRATHTFLDIIPDMPKIKRLDISHTRVTKLKKMDGLIALDMSFTNITRLVDLPNLTMLNISGSKVTKIPFFPKLVQLSMAYVPVKELPTLPKLVKLNAKHSIALETLEKQPKLEYADISYTSIKRLPSLPSLKSIKIHKSPLGNIKMSLIETIDFVE